MPIWDSFSITTKRNVGKCSLIWLTLDGIPRRSPFGKVNSLLSSRTLFKFSTHSGSTSPSKMIHCRLLISPRTLSMILQRRVIQLIKEASRWHRIPNILKVCCSGNKMFFKLNNDRTHFKKMSAYFLRMCVNSPSVHSLVLGSSVPYKASLVIACKKTHRQLLVR